MVYVRLQQDWTDPDGNDHAAGEMVDVDAGTLAALEADGIVADPTSGGFPGPSGKPTSGGFPGPSGDPDGGAWAGPSGEHD